MVTYGIQAWVKLAEQSKGTGGENLVIIRGVGMRVVMDMVGMVVDGEMVGTTMDGDMDGIIRILGGGMGMEIIATSPMAKEKGRAGMHRGIDHQVSVAVKGKIGITHRGTEMGGEGGILFRSNKLEILHKCLELC